MHVLQSCSFIKDSTLFIELLYVVGVYRHQSLNSSTSNERLLFFTFSRTEKAFVWCFRLCNGCFTNHLLRSGMKAEQVGGTNGLDAQHHYTFALSLNHISQTMGGAAFPSSSSACVLTGCICSRIIEELPHNQSLQRWWITLLVKKNIYIQVIFKSGHLSIAGPVILQPSNQSYYAVCTSMAPQESAWVCFQSTKSRWVSSTYRIHTPFTFTPISRPISGKPGELHTESLSVSVVSTWIHSFCDMTVLTTIQSYEAWFFLFQ